ncbi:facilitated trehalose transporter Tret1-like [Pieris napi]|uniref:facilitated trehalose transporter Tret1-like n=1 Tax=Pieris napi TaxID=78633 RepID=UPI001FB91752|nr:facilitated trehalose transporter Tret1-like [Pieris napi]
MEFLAIDSDVSIVPSWMPLLRQSFICSGVVTFYFIHGLFAGAPTVFIPQLKKEHNSTDSIDLSMESWLSSALFYSSIPWAVIIPIFAYYFGRKKTEIILCFDTLISSVILYYSTSPSQIIVSQIIIGMLPAGHLTISLMVLTEYFSPRYRGIFLTVKSATVFWGIWMSNAIGTYFHWSNIAIVSLICSAYTLSTLLWTESPYWLASKGRYRECVETHRWLKGTDAESEEELKRLIDYHKSRFNSRDGRRPILMLKSMFKAIAESSFYKPILIATLAICLFHISGKFAFSIYAIRILKDITVSEWTAYNGMLILDGLTILGMYVGSSFSKFLKRRTMILYASSLGAAFLLILSVYLYLIEYEIVSDNKYVSILLLAAYCMSMSCGPMIMALCVCGELSPLQNRSLFFCVLCIIFNSLMAVTLKLSPYLFKSVGLSGSFLFYGIGSYAVIGLLYKYLPETKDKTILEVQKYFEGNFCIKEENEVMLTERRLVEIEHPMTN